MTQLITTSKQFLADDQGATAVEYGLISSLILLTCLTALTATGAALGEVFEYLAGGLSA